MKTADVLNIFKRKERKKMGEAANTQAPKGANKKTRQKVSKYIVTEKIVGEFDSQTSLLKFVASRGGLKQGQEVWHAKAYSLDD